MASKALAPLSHVKDLHPKFAFRHRDMGTGLKTAISAALKEVENYKETVKLSLLNERNVNDDDNKLIQYLLHNIAKFMNDQQDVLFSRYGDGIYTVQESDQMLILMSNLATILSCNAKFNGKPIAPHPQYAFEFIITTTPTTTLAVPYRTLLNTFSFTIQKQKNEDNFLEEFLFSPEELLEPSYSFNFEATTGLEAMMYSDIKQEESKVETECNAQKVEGKSKVRSSKKRRLSESSSSNSSLPICAPPEEEESESENGEEEDENYDENNEDGEDDDEEEEEEPKKKKKKKTESEKDKELQTFGFTIEGGKSKDFLKHLEKNTEDHIKNIRELFNQTLNYGKNHVIVVNSHLKTLEKFINMLPTKVDEKTLKIIWKCSHCLVHCPSNWEIPSPTGRPKKDALKKANDKKSKMGLKNF